LRNIWNFREGFYAYLLPKHYISVFQGPDRGREADVGGLENSDGGAQKGGAQERISLKS
jgi:hypothetical protein